MVRQCPRSLVTKGWSTIQSRILLPRWLRFTEVHFFHPGKYGNIPDIRATRGEVPVVWELLFGISTPMYRCFYHIGCIHNMKKSHNTRAIQSFPTEATHVHNVFLFQILLVVVTTLCTASGHPPLYNPYYQFLRYNQPHYGLPYVYGPTTIPSYAPYHLLPYIPQPYMQNQLAPSQPQPFSTLNVLAEAPYAIKNNKFTVVPMTAVAKESVNLVSNAQVWLHLCRD